MTAPTATIQLTMPNQDHLFEHLTTNAKWANPKNVVKLGEQKGRTVVICGAGPSLANHKEDIKQQPAHQVWAANSALPYMIDHGYPVTHGISVDMSEDMYTDVNEWQRTFPVKYLISSGVHPELILHLRKANRQYRMFHSYLGIKDPEGWTPPLEKSGNPWQPPAPQFSNYEMWIYTHLYPATVQVGYGLNTVPRAICLALWMGFKHVIVYGADCACAPDSTLMPTQDDPGYADWLKTLKLYPDGRSDPTQSTPAKYGPNAVICQGIIKGRLWHTRPDMLISARHLVDLAKMYAPGNQTGQVLELRGDTLPNACVDMPQEWWDRVPNLTGQGSVQGFGLNVPVDTQIGEAL